jgi:hypothetical protein
MLRWSHAPPAVGPALRSALRLGSLLTEEKVPSLANPGTWVRSTAVSSRRGRSPPSPAPRCTPPTPPPCPALPVSPDLRPPPPGAVAAARARQRQGDRRPRLALPCRKLRDRLRRAAPSQRSRRDLRRLSPGARRPCQSPIRSAHISLWPAPSLRRALISLDLAAISAGAPASELATLKATNAVTISRLMELAPPGTPDPTPLLYNDACYVPQLVEKRSTSSGLRG